MSETVVREDRPEPTAAVRRESWILAAASLALSLATSLFALGPSGVAELGVYFDGHFYIEIARSFPLPYAPEGRDYLGQAPGFSALLYPACSHSIACASRSTSRRFRRA